MTRTHSFCATALVAMSAAGCSSKSTEAASQASTSKDAGDTREWTRIIEGSWTLGPGEEKTRDCIKKELTDDIYVSAIRPVSPLGTHHTLLTLGDGQIDCTTAVAQGLIYAAGLGSEGLNLPPGVAIKLPKGKYLNLGLHVYNTTGDTLSGTSAMEIVTIPKSEVKYESEALLAGPINLDLPPGEKTVVSGECNLNADQKMYALFPHMHQWGTHIKTTITSGGVPSVIHDADYNFAEQYQLPLDPILELHAGDKVTTECTYDNTTTKPITFGESSDTEMCFSVLFRYPALGTGGFCFGGGAAPGDGGTTTLSGPPCAAPGAPGNELGVGKECAKGGSACSTKADICLADFASGTFPNFCTMLCGSDADCGTGAKCQGSSGRAICIPTTCLSGDAGAP